MARCDCCEPSCLDCYPNRGLVATFQPALQVNYEGYIIAELTEKQVDRIAQKVVELLKAQNG